MSLHPALFVSYLKELFDYENPEQHAPNPIPPLGGHTISETLDLLHEEVKNFTTHFTEEASYEDPENSSILLNLIQLSDHAVKQHATQVIKRARSEQSLDIPFEHPSLLYRNHSHRVLCVWTMKNTDLALAAETAITTHLVRHQCSPKDFPTRTPKANAERIAAIHGLQPRIPDTQIPALATMMLQTAVTITTDQLADYASYDKYTKARTPASHAISLAVHHLARLLLNPTFNPTEADETSNAAG